MIKREKTQLKKYIQSRRILLLLLFTCILTITSVACQKPMTTEDRKDRMKELLKDKYGEEFEVRELYNTGKIEAWCYPVSNPTMVFKADSTLEMEEIVSDFYLQNIVCKQVELQLQPDAEQCFYNCYVSAHIATADTSKYLNPESSGVTLRSLEDYFSTQGIEGRITISVFVDDNTNRNSMLNEYLFLEEKIIKRVNGGEFPNTHFNLYLGNAELVKHAKDIIEIQRWDWITVMSRDSWIFSRIVLFLRKYPLKERMIILSIMIKKIYV